MPQQEGDLGPLLKQLQSQMPTGTQTGENGNDRIPQGGTLANWRAHASPMGRMPVSVLELPDFSWKPQLAAKIFLLMLATR